MDDYTPDNIILNETGRCVFINSEIMIDWLSQTVQRLGGLEEQQRKNAG